MTDVWIGWLDDSDFDYEKCDNISNIPRRRSPFFPNRKIGVLLHCSDRPWDAVIEKIMSGEYEGKQTDWGAYVAKVTKKQIFEFMREFYGEVSDKAAEFIRAALRHDEVTTELTPTDACLLGVIHGQAHALKDWVDLLEEDKLYALCAIET